MLCSSLDTTVCAGREYVDRLRIAIALRIHLITVFCNKFPLNESYSTVFITKENSLELHFIV